MSAPYLIALNGCDDSTYARVELTEAEAAVVARVIREVNARSFVNCQPKADLTAWEEADSYDRKVATEKHWAEGDE